jgi:DNA-binding LacI/PurR family transcriptional regulator
MEWPIFDALMQIAPERRPTGIVCVNDYEAIEITQRLSAMNLTVPGDVSVVGFDNILRTLPNGAGLTTVAQPFEEIGSTAATTLLKRIETPDAPSAYIELPAKLVVRQSTRSLR